MNMKKGLSVLCTLVMLLCLLPTVEFTASAATSGDYTYTVADGEATITEVSNTYTGNIPSTLGGYPVTSIATWAFSKCSNLQAVYIPNSITNIGKAAFYNCSNLQAVYISDLTAWCEISFADYSANPLFLAQNLYLNNELVTELVIPDGVTSIRDNAFIGCNMTSITIPASVTNIGTRAFNGCTQLKEVRYGGEKADLTIGEYNPALTSATWQYNINCAFTADCDTVCNICGKERTPIAAHTYDSCTDRICNVCSSRREPGHIYSNKYDFSCNLCSFVRSLDDAYTYESVTIDGNSGVQITGVTDENAFVGEIVLPATLGGSPVIGISDYAFKDCDSLTSVTIPDSVTYIGTNAFSSCSSLRTVTLSKNLTVISDMLFSSCGSLTDLTIPDSVTSIGTDAFYNCDRLTSVTIPYGVTRIGRHAFDNCDRLTSITIPESVTSIENFAFYMCPSLTSIIIPSSVTSIGGFVFSSALKSILLPDSVTSFEGTFYYCSNLTDVWYTGDQADRSAMSIGSDSQQVLTSATWHYNAETDGKHVYDNACDGTCAWCDFDRDRTHTYDGLCDTSCNVCGEERADVHDFTENTLQCALCGIVRGLEYTVSSSRGTVTIDKYVGEWSVITLPTTIEGYPVTEIADSAFEANHTLTQIVVPDGVVRIGDWAFCDCTALTSVVLPDGLSSLGEGCFLSCLQLTSIEIPEGVQVLPYASFEGCTALEEVALPNSLTTVEDSAFNRCEALSLVRYNGSANGRTDIVIEDNNTCLTDAEWQYLEASGFVTVLGATIRTDVDMAKQGLRYEIKVGDAATMAAVNEVGVLLLPKGMLGSAELSLDTTAVLKIGIVRGDANWDTVLADGGFQASLLGSVINRRQNLEIVARSYVVLDNGDVLYGDVSVKSVTSVALKIAAAEKAGGASVPSDIEALLSQTTLTDAEIAKVLTFCRENIAYL